MRTHLDQIPNTEEDYGEKKKFKSQPFTEEQNNKEKSIKHLMKDPLYRRKLLRTVWISGTFISLGLAFGLNGPTLFDLRIITNTDLEKASAFLTGCSIGHLLGSVLSGAIYAKVNKDALFFCGAFALAGFSIATPYCSSYALMIAMRLAVGIAHGVIDTTGNAEHMRIWGNDGTVLMQLLHFVFALGAVMSPLYTGPFLAKRMSDMNPMNASSTNETFPQTTSEPPSPQETDVKYAFIISGVIIILTGLPFFVFFVKNKIGKKMVLRNSDKKLAQRKIPRPMYLFILVTLCCFCMLYCCVEDGFASFLMTFVVEEYYPLVTKIEGAYMTAVFWASFAVSRFIMIFLSRY